MKREPKKVKSAEIKGHPLLSQEQRKGHPLLSQEQRILWRSMRDRSYDDGGYPYSLFDFAKGELRRHACAYVKKGGSLAERDLHRAAILYVYEALKETDLDIVKQWDGFDEMLRSLEYLAGDIPP